MRNRSSIRTVPVIVVSFESIQNATRKISNCERCDMSAETPFHAVLNEVLGFQRGAASYLLVETATCPKCKARVGESTRVTPNTLTMSLKTFRGDAADTDIVLIDEETVTEAESLVTGCESCAPECEIAFDYLLDEITGNDPTMTEYLLPRSAQCPRCFSPITEKTLIVP